VASTTTQAPTLQPTIEPTQFPTQFPTLPPSPKPTPEPTHLPTKGSVTAVAVTFTITATAAPSAQDESDLETAVTASLPDGSVTDFAVASSQTARRRLLLAAQDALPSADARVAFAASPAAKDTSPAVRPHGRRLLATYAWAVSLTVVADLSTTATTYSSAAAFATAVAASLNANLAAQISIASVSSVGTVSAAFVSRTKAPTPLPSTLYPTPLPSPLADPDPYADDDTAWVWFLVIGLVWGGIASVAGVVGYNKYKARVPPKAGAHLFDATAHAAQLQTRLKERNAASGGGPRKVGYADVGARDLHMPGDLRVSNESPSTEAALAKALGGVGDTEKGVGGRNASMDRPPSVGAGPARRKSLGAAGERHFDTLAQCVLQLAEADVAHDNGPSAESVLSAEELGLAQFLLPLHTNGVDSMSELKGCTDEWLAAKTGMKEFHIAKFRTAVLDMTADLPAKASDGFKGSPVEVAAHEAKIKALAAASALQQAREAEDTPAQKQAWADLASVVLDKAEVPK
jgi:hypothetical protein